MTERNKQHMGRSTDEQRDLVGRDVRGGDVTARDAQRNDVPMPNEDGTGFRADQPVDTEASRDRKADAGDAERLKQGGSGARETST